MKVILVEVILYIIVIDSIEAIGRALVPYIETILDLSYVSASTSYSVPRCLHSIFPRVELEVGVTMRFTCLMTPSW